MSQPSARFNVTAARKYETKGGEEKTHWVGVGRATQWDDGNITIELHAVPVGNWFDGKLMLFPEDKKDQGAAPRQQQPRPQRQASPSDSSYGDESSGDIPFAPFRRHSYY